MRYLFPSNILEKPTAHSTCKKLAVLRLNEAFPLWRDKLCFVSSSVAADSLVLRNRQLLVAAKR